MGNKRLEDNLLVSESCVCFWLWLLNGSPPGAKAFTSRQYCFNWALYSFSRQYFSSIRPLNPNPQPLFTFLNVVKCLSIIRSLFICPCFTFKEAIVNVLKYRFILRLENILLLYLSTQAKQAANIHSPSSSWTTNTTFAFSGK